MFYRIFVLTLFLTVVACDSGAPAIEEESLLLIPLESGVSTFSENRNKRFEVIHSEERYANVFRLANPFSVPPRLGEIDFTTYVVVAALLGEQQDEGWRAEITRIEEEEFHYVVWVSSTRVDAEYATSVFPYSFAMVQNDKPIRFGEETINRLGPS